MISRKFLFLGSGRKRIYSSRDPNRLESKGGCHASQTDFNFFYLDDRSAASVTGRYFHWSRDPKNLRVVQRTGLGQVDIHGAGRAVYIHAANLAVVRGGSGQRATRRRADPSRIAYAGRGFSDRVHYADGDQTALAGLLCAHRN